MNIPETTKLNERDEGMEGEDEWWGDAPADDADEISVGDREFITGSAGCGKTYLCKQRIADDPYYGVLCSTTGISAVNLGEGVTTINSLLGFFNTESLIDAYAAGYINTRLNKLAKSGHHRIIIDEVSMMNKRQLDIIHKAMLEVSEYSGVQKPLSLVLVGDMAQLSPIPDTNRQTGKKEPTPWVFDAECWEIFERNTTRLTKIWRQSDPKFLDALNAIRAGNGHDGAQHLKDAGVEFTTSSSIHYPGTTIVAKNDEVDRFNFAAQQQVKGEKHSVKSKRRGKLLGEWKNIPEQLNLKVGDYIMILTNDAPRFTFVNGDCGYVESFNGHEFQIRLKRNDKIVSIGPLQRFAEQKDEPDDYMRRKCEDLKLAPYLRDTTPNIKDEKKKIWRWVLGEITYWPLRLAYAITTHKSQSLSLDAIQVDLRAQFMSQPAMVYTALSRARTPEGLKIVGTPELLAARCKIDKRIRRFL